MRAIKDYDIGIEHYLVLYSKYFNLGWLSAYRVKEIIYTHLINLGYISANKNILKAGKEAVEKIEGPQPEEKDYKEEFSEFWLNWPGTDKVLHFPASGRAMRGNRHEAYVAYKACRNSGVKQEDLLSATDNHVKALTDESARLVKNQLKYLPGPTRWLKEGMYLPWIKIEQPTQNRKINVS